MSRHRETLADLAVELAGHSTGFCRSLPEGVLTALAGLVRSMNCYYSNLIEGHHTHPVDIERALRNDYSQDVGKRHLQLEARAHISVQHWIDSGGLRGRAVSADGICEVHRRFGERLPKDLLYVQDSERRVVDCAWPGPECRQLQGASCGMRPATSQRPGRARQFFRGGACSIHAILPRDMPRSSEIHGRVGTARPFA